MVQFLAKTAGGEGGGWWDHPPALATLGKMALGMSVGFLGIGRSTSSVSRRVVKLTVSHYYLVPLPLQKRGYGDEIRNPVVFMISNTVSELGVGGRGMHNGCDFWNWKGEVNCSHFSAIGQIFLHSHYEIFYSAGARRPDEKSSRPRLGVSAPLGGSHPRP